MAQENNKFCLYKYSPDVDAAAKEFISKLSMLGCDTFALFFGCSANGEGTCCVEGDEDNVKGLVGAMAVKHPLVQDIVMAATRKSMEIDNGDEFDHYGFES